MSHAVAALYQFTDLPDAPELRAPLRALCDGLGIRGTLILAPEGINGTVAGTRRGHRRADRGVRDAGRCSAGGSTAWS